MTKPLTALQRRALNLASHKGGAPVAPAFTTPPRTHIAHTVALSLHDRGLALFTNQTLLITQAGRTALNQPVQEPVRYLHKDPAKGYTDRPELAARETEHIDVVGTEGVNQALWVVDAETQRKITENALHQAESRRLAQILHALEVGRELEKALEPLAREDKRIADRLRLVRQQIRGIERLKDAA